MSVLFSWPPAKPTPAYFCSSPVHKFIDEHSPALHSAVQLLAGDDAGRKLDELTDALSREAHFSRQTISRLEWLEDILSLRNVSDHDTIESACFSAIDPAAPVVEDICLLTDGFQDALDASAEFMRRDDAKLPRYREVNPQSSFASAKSDPGFAARATGGAK